MEISMILNGKTITASIEPDMLLLDFVRSKGCLSVKRGCETANCGLCTVLMDGVPILSCSTLAARAAGHQIQTLEGLQEEAADFAVFIADQGAEQCGFCNPGFVMNTIALLRENPDPTDEEIKAYLAGNLCRCSGYEGQLRGIRNYLEQKKMKSEITDAYCCEAAGEDEEVQTDADACGNTEAAESDRCANTEAAEMQAKSDRCVNTEAAEMQAESDRCVNAEAAEIQTDLETEKGGTV